MSMLGNRPTGLRALKSRAAMLAVASLPAPAFAQAARMDLLAEDVELRLDWDAYRNDEARLAIELCPTNVCEQFVASNPELQPFLRFVDLYVVFASHYGDLRSVSRGRVPPISYIADRLEQVAAEDLLVAGCGSNLTAESISCTLQSLGRVLEIEKYVVRYDQGRHSVPEANWVSADLGVANIESSLEWCASFGLSVPASLRRE